MPPELACWRAVALDLAGQIVELNRMILALGEKLAVCAELLGKCAERKESAS